MKFVARELTAMQKKIPKLRHRRGYVKLEIS
jgi:hypothetical protein